MRIILCEASSCQRCFTKSFRLLNFKLDRPVIWWINVTLCQFGEDIISF